MEARMQDTAPKRAPPQLVSLQALRLIAAGMVVYVHALATYANKIGATENAWVPAALGEFGVKLFFCISGYIIYQSSGHLHAGLATAGDFMKRRLTRIVPLYWAATLLYALKLTLQGEAPAIADVIRSLFFIPYADANGLMRPVLGVGWSLNYEMMFYLLFGLTLLLNPGRRIAALSTALTLLLLGHYLLPPTDGASALHIGIYLLGDYYLLYFLAGLLISRLQQKGFLHLGLPRLQAETVIAALLTLLFAYCLLTLTVALPHLLKEGIVAILCIVCLLLCTLESSPAGHEAPATCLLKLGGDASYCTYLTHGFIMGPCARLLALLDMSPDPTLFALSMVLICSSAGILLYCVFEKPLLKKIAELLRPPLSAQLAPRYPYGK